MKVSKMRENVEDKKQKISVKDVKMKEVEDEQHRQVV
jgi:hypothetical protein